MNTIGLSQASGISLAGSVQGTGSPAAKGSTEETKTIVDGFKKSEGEQEKKINWKSIGKLALGTVTFGALGVFAGLATGPIAAAAGAVAGLAGGVGAGVLAGAYLGDKFGHGDSPKVAGIAIWSTIAGAAAGLGGGIYLGLAVANPAAAITLGALGAIGGFGKSLLGLASN